MKVLFAATTAILIAGCAPNDQSTGKAAGEAAAYRNGTFKKAAIDMVACTSYGMHIAQPKMFFEIGKDGEWFTVLGGPNKGATEAIWQIAIRDAGADSSEVELRSKGAAKSALDEVWKVVEFCETYEPG